MCNLVDQYFESRSKFENGMKPIATFPRSLSNLERRSEPTKSAETGRVCKKEQTCYHFYLITTHFLKVR